MRAVPPSLSRLVALAFGAALLAAPSASAQVDSREAIALQNQILQLRQEVEQLRRSGGGGSAAPSRGGGDVPGS